MMTFYAAAGSYQIRSEDGKNMPYIMRLGKLQPVSIPEFSLWSMLLWDVLTYEELRKKFYDKMEETEIEPSSFDKSLEMLVKRKLIIKGVGFNFGEVTLSATGKLEIALVQMVPLAEAELQPHNDEDLEEQDILDRSDVKQWYTQKGIALLSALIDELNVQGHKRLTIKENGDVFVTASGKQQPVDTIPDSPPRPAWEDLCVLAREDDIAAEVCNQELTVSWA